MKIPVQIPARVENESSLRDRIEVYSYESNSLALSFPPRANHCDSLVVELAALHFQLVERKFCPIHKGESFQ